MRCKDREKTAGSRKQEAGSREMGDGRWEMGDGRSKEVSTLLFVRGFLYFRLKTT
ncbi:hypothetical protein [Dokdonia sinensis]|uniref:hypothetical protein n=1 Tax=Dokdonia sinensis TaxID=2479847 RepID=UPI001374DA4A|nr:hypothetical protein [Dokdonia sinensis]